VDSSQCQSDLVTNYERNSVVSVRESRAPM